MQELYANLKEKQEGYLRYFDLRIKVHVEDIYEADEEDFGFLKAKFPKILHEGLSLREQAKHPTVAEFERAICYLENTKDKSFAKFRDPKFDANVLDEIQTFWE